MGIMKNLQAALIAFLAGTSFCLFADGDQASCGALEVSGEILYWKPHLSSLELSSGTTSITQFVQGANTIDFVKEEDVDPRLSWGVGYRLGLSYRFAPSGFGTELQWTYFCGSGQRHEGSQGGWISTTKANIRLNQVDLALTYDCKVCGSWSFRPAVGLRGANIQESLKANLVTSVLYLPSTPATLTRGLDDHESYRGVGPFIRLRAVVDLIRGFGLYASGDIGLLYSDCKVTFNDSSLGTAPISHLTRSWNKRHTHTFDWNIGLAIGINWKVPIGCSKSLVFNLGFEHHQYFNQVRLGVNRGDLTFDGGVFGCSLVY